MIPWSGPHNQHLRRRGIAGRLCGLCCPPHSHWVPEPALPTSPCLWWGPLWDGLWAIPPELCLPSSSPWLLSTGSFTPSRSSNRGLIPRSPSDCCIGTIRLGLFLVSNVLSRWKTSRSNFSCHKIRLLSFCKKHQSYILLFLVLGVVRTLPCLVLTKSLSHSYCYGCHFSF